MSISIFFTSARDGSRGVAFSGGRSGEESSTLSTIFARIGEDKCSSVESRSPLLCLRPFLFVNRRLKDLYEEIFEQQAAIRLAL